MILNSVDFFPSIFEILSRAAAKDALFCTFELRPLVRHLAINWMNTRNITGQVNHQILDGLESVYYFC